MELDLYRPFQTVPLRCSTWLTYRVYLPLSRFIRSPRFWGSSPGCDISAFELASGQSCPDGAADDADGDGLCHAEDNCPAGFNPGQEAVTFPFTLVAAAADRFAWGEPADVHHVRGDLDGVDSYDTNEESELFHTGKK